MTEPMILGEWPRNSRETIRVLLSEYNGHHVVDVRVWYPGDDGNLKPGRSGITLGIRHVPRLTEAIAKAADAVRGV
jgi:hypothetical protein